MCGRFRLGKGKEALKKYFGPDVDLEFPPRYNIAPTQRVVTIRQNAEAPVREASLMRWGLVPFWAKDPSIGYKMINARSETVAAKPAYRECLKRRRCLIPADGFYEWKKLDKGKQPFCFVMNDDSVFALAGLWDRWKTPEGDVLETCTILTTTPNELLADVHDRMPVILGPDHYDLWLDPGFSNTEEIVALLQPHDARRMRRFPVSTDRKSVV